MSKKQMSAEEYKRRSVTVGLNAIEARAFVPPVGRQVSAPNVKHDPIAKAVALEIMSKYPKLCFNKDGTLNNEGFKSAAVQHLRTGNQRSIVARIGEHLKRR